MTHTTILPTAFTTAPWKNGGGVTHEIAKSEEDGAWLWRLSIAEVATDGPFSAFLGLSRILTVIEGEGLQLHLPLSREPRCFKTIARAATPMAKTLFVEDALSRSKR